MTVLDGRARSAAIALLAVLLALPAAAQQPSAQARAISLTDALQLAESASEPVAIARAGITRARGQTLQARSARLPQVLGTLSYTRALASEFSALGGGTPDSTAGPPLDCGGFQPGAGTEARLD